MSVSPAFAGRWTVLGIIRRTLRRDAKAAGAKIADRGAVVRLANAGSVAQVVLALALALVMAPLVRTVTYALNDTVGRAWPFSLARCRPTAHPDCLVPPPDRPPAAPHVRTGRL